MMSSLRRTLSGALLVGLLSLAAPVAASPLASGATVLPVPAVPGCDLCSGPFLDTLFDVAWGTPAFGGRYDTVVFMNAGGTLDFAYQIHVAEGSYPVGTVSMLMFDGWDTDVFYYTQEGTAAPDSATRSASGAQIDFAFDPPWGGAVDPEEHSMILVIRTNATNYKPGIVFITPGIVTPSFDDGPQLEPVIGGAFAPDFTPIPEPATMTLTGIGLAGAMARRRRSRRS
jgi:hypothetical protein